MNGLTQSKRIRNPLFLIAMALVCLAISSSAQMNCQEGCLTNANTALGDFALSKNTTGGANTATGNEALQFNTTGQLQHGHWCVGAG